MRKFRGYDGGKILLFNAAIFSMSILIMDLTQIYAQNFYESTRTVAYWIFTYTLYSTAYVITHDMKNSKVSEQLKMKARTIKVLAFIPIIDTVFSIFYTLERRYSEASKKNSFRGDWWKGLVVGISLFLISMNLPLYPNTESIAPSLTASTVYMEAVNNVIQITVFTVIPLSILFDRNI